MNDKPNFATGQAVPSRFVKMMRSEEITDLIEVSPLAFVLASIIALRARYCPGKSLKGLEPGEALLGDFKRCGLSEQEYRTAKRNLAKWKFATFKSTPSGTIGKLIDTRLFDVLPVMGQRTDQHPANGQPTDSQRLTENSRKAERSGKKEKKESAAPSLPEVLAFALSKGMPEEMARDFYHHNNGQGWTYLGSGGQWRSALRSWCSTGERMRSKPGRPHRPERDPLSGPLLDMSTLGRGNL